LPEDTVTHWHLGQLHATLSVHELSNQWFVGFGGLKIKQLEKYLRCCIVVDSSERTIIVCGVDEIPDDNVVEMIEFFSIPQPLATGIVGPAEEVKSLKGKPGENARELMEQTGIWITFANDELHMHL